jgi:hypothetical protein
VSPLVSFVVQELPVGALLGVSLLASAASLWALAPTWLAVVSLLTSFIKF